MAAVQDPSSSRFRSLRDMPRSNRSSRSDGSVASHTTFSDANSEFDPDRDALVSTRQFDNPDQLPKQYQPSYRQQEDQEEPNYAIDTSALQRAFPEFSHASSSDEDEDISIEIGRGGKKLSHSLDDSRNSIMSGVRSSSPAIRLDSPKISTPPRSALRNVSNRGPSSNGDNLRKGAQLRQASLALQDTHDSPNQSQKDKNSKQRSASGDQRRTLSEMHAKVSETYDGSYLSDEKPASVTNNARNTRFGHAKTGEYTAADAHGTQEAEKAKQYVADASANNTMSDMPTQRSFMLPDLPNLSELVSGVYQDGTPVFTRQGKLRTTRFVSPPHNNTETKSGHIPVGSVPIPDDEKAIFVSLRLLQEKVAQLELEKSETEQNAEDLKQEVMILKSENTNRQKRERNRAGGDDDGYDKRSRKLAIEKSRLEAANLAFQNDLDAAERKIASHENNLRKLTRERDAAVSQLGVAYLSSQELKSENQSLLEENNKMKRQLAKLLGGDSRKSNRHEEDTVRSQETEQDRQTTQDVVGATETEYAAHQSAKERRQNRDDHPGTGKRRSRVSNPEGTRTKISKQISEELSKLNKQHEDDSLFSLDLPSLLPQSRNKNKAQVKPTSEKKPNTSKQRVKKVMVEDVESDDGTSEGDEEAVTGGFKTRSDVEHDQDLTLLSDIDTQEIALLRKTLEEERAARKRPSQAFNDTGKTDTMASAYSSKHSQNLPRKSSLKNAAATMKRPASAGGEPTMTHRTNVTDGDDVSIAQSTVLSKQKHRSEESLSRRRRGQASENMTSAFILPDITIQNHVPGVPDPVTLSSSAQRVMDETVQHKANNCSVCKRVITDDAQHDHHASRSGKASISIPKPVPVSERMPEPTAYNEEPTLRPSQSPALALATVLKGLEDELAHLKLQLAKFQRAYNGHDASISRRQRKSIYQKIESLLKEIDTKADQIYSLYDVLEGQKQDGHEFTEEEVEVTLQSIGIDAPADGAVDLTGGRGRENSRGRPASSRGDLETDDEELPWEGIESTVEFTERSVGSRMVN